MKPLKLSKRAISPFFKKLILSALSFLLFLRVGAVDFKSFNTNDLLNNNSYKSSDYIPAERATVMCETRLVSGNDYQPFVAKLDANGNYIWEQDFFIPTSPGAASGLRATGIKVLQNGELLVGGMTQKFSGSIALNEIFLMRLTSTGNLIWFQRYDQGITYGLDKVTVAELSDGSLIAATSSSQNNTMSILKTNTSGTSPLFKRYYTARNYSSIEDIYIDGTDIYAIGNSGHQWDFFGGMAIRFDAGLNMIWSRHFVSENSSGSMPTSLWDADHLRSNMVFKGVTDGSGSGFLSTIRVAGFIHNANQYGGGLTYCKGFTVEIDKNGNLDWGTLNVYTFNSTFSALYDVDSYKRHAVQGPGGSVTYTTDYVMSGVQDLNTSLMKNLISTPTDYTSFGDAYETGIYNIFGHPEQVLIQINPPAYMNSVSMIGTGSGQATSLSANKVHWANPDLFRYNETCLPFAPISSTQPMPYEFDLNLSLESDVIANNLVLPPQEQPAFIPLLSLCEDPCNQIIFDITASGQTIISTVTVNTGVTFDYTISFGDGGTSGTLFPVSAPGSHTISHTYMEPGTYVVCITVLINTGDQVVTCTKCKTIIIDPVMMKKDENKNAEITNSNVRFDMVNNVLTRTATKPSSSSPSSQSGPKNINEAAFSVNVYPNPSNGLVNIGFKTDVQEDVTIGVYNLNGQLVKQITSDKTFDKGHNVQNCDISELSAGMYYFKIESNSFSVVKPLVKQ